MTNYHSASTAEFRVDLDQCLNALTPLERQLVELYMQGYTQAEIADKLGVHQSTISARMKKALERVRKEISA